jgi:hypothetical protein
MNECISRLILEIRLFFFVELLAKPCSVAVPEPHNFSVSVRAAANYTNFEFCINFSHISKCVERSIAKVGRAIYREN